jgi:anti-sigma regulatory factor (Ser/Thr protein kinase)
MLVRGVFPAQANHVCVARAVTRRVLDGWWSGDLDLFLVMVCELVTNAMRYGGSRNIELSISLTEQGRLRLAVVDEARGSESPHLRRVPANAMHGRGLHLVDACAESWGFVRRTGLCTVWCEVAGAVEAKAVQEAG